MRLETLLALEGYARIWNTPGFAEGFSFYEWE